MALIEQYRDSTVYSITLKIGQPFLIGSDSGYTEIRYSLPGNGSYNIYKNEYESGSLKNDGPYTETYIVPDKAGHIDVFGGAYIYSDRWPMAHYVITVVDGNGSAPPQSKPIAIDDYVLLSDVAGGRQFSISDILGNDIDPENDVIRLNGIESSSSQAEITLPYPNSSGNYFTLSLNSSHPEYGKDFDILYGIEDFRGGFDEGVLHITSDLSYFTPTSANDKFKVIDNSILKVNASNGVLSNDSDPNGNSLISSLVRGPSHGALDFKSDGSFEYVPDDGFIGKDTFSYLASDGRFVSAAAMVEIEVVAPIPVPEATSTYVRGTAGTDTLDYSSAKTSVLIAGLEGNDVLRGGAGNDALNGGAGNDILTGGAGNDSITGGLGADRLGGGAGNDTFHVALGDLALTGATDLIVDFQGAGQAGGDVIRLSGFTTGSTLELVGTSGNARIYEVHDTAGVSEGQLLVSAGGVLGNPLTTSDYSFVYPVSEPAPSGTYVRGTAGADTLDYSSATTRMLIAGLDGNDTLRGGSGDDALNGGAGNDVLTGAAGNDSITGGHGADRTGGGGGNDTFHIAFDDLATTGATDLIVDFQGAGQAGGDVIRFSGFATGSTLELVGTSGSARVYEVHDTAGVSEGQLLVSAGGTLGQVLTMSDYAFA